jgi:hypothetical protein
MAHFVNDAYFSLEAYWPTVSIAWHIFWGRSHRAFEAFVAIDRSHAL